MSSFNHKPVSGMTLQQFSRLSEHEQFRNLLVRGVCIADRKTDEHLVLLFQLDRFYVEVYFNLYCDEITELKLFEDVEELSPYLEVMDISKVI